MTAGPGPIGVGGAARRRLGRAGCRPRQVLERLGTGSEGLSSVDAADRLRTFGANVLLTHRVTALGVLKRQLRNPLLFLLLGAAVISGLTGDPADAVIIAAILALSVGLGFVNEYRSERAAVALHDNIRHQTQVRRDGADQRVDVRELVPGDIVTLGIGNVVPADIRLLEATRFECDEAVLTGESMPAAKSAHAAPGDESDPVPSTCAFMGTIVHQGSARGVVVSTGSATAFGRIAVGLGSPPAYTAFQIGLNEFSRAAGLDRGHPHRLDLRHQRRHVETGDRRRAVFPGDRDRDHPAAAAGHRQRQPRGGVAGAGASQGAGQAPGYDRGSRQHPAALHRQDGHPDGGHRHVRGVAGCGRRRVAGSARSGAGVQ